MTVTLVPPLGSHVPPQQVVTTDGQPAQSINESVSQGTEYQGRANAPWPNPGRAQYVGLPICQAQVAAEDTWTPESFFCAYRNGNGQVGVIDVSVRGVFTATVTLQRSFDNGVSWNDVATYTGETETRIDNPSAAVKWRLGVKTGDFTSGPLVVRLSQA